MGATSWDTFKDEVLKVKETFTVQDVVEIVGVSETTARKLVKSATTNAQIAATSTRGEYRSNIFGSEHTVVVDDQPVPEDRLEEVTPATKPAESVKPESGNNTKAARADVAERDMVVFTAIVAHGPITRNELVELLALPGNEVYLSLYRLRKAETIVRVAVGKTAPAWKAA